MEKIRNMTAYLIGIIFLFYILPLIIKDTGSGMLVLLLLIPITCFLISLIYGIKNLFDWRFPILVMLLFIPTIFLFYNESAAIYSLIYGFIAAFGSFLGSAVSKKVTPK